MDKKQKKAIWAAVGGLGALCGWILWNQRQATVRANRHTDALEAIVEHMEKETQLLYDAQFEEIIDLEFDE